MDKYTVKFPAYVDFQVNDLLLITSVRLDFNATTTTFDMIKLSHEFNPFGNSKLNNHNESNDNQKYRRTVNLSSKPTISEQAKRNLELLPRGAHNAS